MFAESSRKEARMYEAPMTPRLARALRKARQAEEERAAQEKAARTFVVNTDHATDVSIQIVHFWFDVHITWVKMCMPRA